MSGLVRNYIALLLICIGGTFFLTSCQSNKACEYEHVATWDSGSTGVELDMILGIGIASPGRVYAPTGKGEDGVLVFDTDGKIIDSWGKGLVSKHGLRVIDDKVWVTDRERQVVMEFTLDGELLRIFGTEGKSGLGENEFNKPSDIAIGPNGNIYVSDGYANSRVMRFGSEGKFKQSWGTKGDRPGEFELVHNIAIDKKGRVFIADRENMRVQIFDADGKFIDEWEHVGKAYGLYIDDMQKVYITDGVANNVYVTNIHGEVLSMFGKTGDGPGEFKMAHSITVDKKGNIYVTEGDGKRIQVFASK